MKKAIFAACMASVSIQPLFGECSLKRIFCCCCDTDPAQVSEEEDHTGSASLESQIGVQPELQPPLAKSKPKPAPEAKAKPKAKATPPLQATDIILATGDLIAMIVDVPEKFLDISDPVAIDAFASPNLDGLVNVFSNYKDKNIYIGVLTKQDEIVVYELEKHDQDKWKVIGKKVYASDRNDVFCEALLKKAGMITIPEGVIVLFKDPDLTKVIGTFGSEDEDYAEIEAFQKRAELDVVYGYQDAMKIISNQGGTFNQVMSIAEIKRANEAFDAWRSQTEAEIDSLLVDIEKSAEEVVKKGSQEKIDHLAGLLFKIDQIFAPGSSQYLPQQMEKLNTIWGTLSQESIKNVDAKRSELALLYPISQAEDLVETLKTDDSERLKQEMVHLLLKSYAIIVKSLKDSPVLPLISSRFESITDNLNTFSNGQEVMTRFNQKEKKKELDKLNELHTQAKELIIYEETPGEIKRMKALDADGRQKMADVLAQILDMSKSGPIKEACSEIFDGLNNILVTSDYQSYQLICQIILNKKYTEAKRLISALQRDTSEEEKSKIVDLLKEIYSLELIYFQKDREFWTSLEQSPLSKQILIQFQSEKLDQELDKYEGSNQPIMSPYGLKSLAEEIERLTGAPLSGDLRERFNRVIGEPFKKLEEALSVFESTGIVEQNKVIDLEELAFEIQQSENELPEDLKNRLNSIIYINDFQTRIAGVKQMRGEYYQDIKDRSAQEMRTMKDEIDTHLNELEELEALLSGLETSSQLQCTISELRMTKARDYFDSFAVYNKNLEEAITLKTDKFNALWREHDEAEGQEEKTRLSHEIDELSAEITYYKIQLAVNEYVIATNSWEAGRAAVEVKNRFSDAIEKESEVKGIANNKQLESNLQWRAYAPIKPDPVDDPFEA